MRGQWIAVFISTIALCSTGCRSHQHAKVLDYDDNDMVGSHSAGTETWKPLINESVEKLLGRHCVEVMQVAATDEDGVPVQVPCRRRVAFIGVENASSEDIGDFKEQIYENIDSAISASGVYSTISKRFVDATLRQTRLRPEDLFLPDGRRSFAATLEEMDQPFDYLLFAKITSGTTYKNDNYQRDYLLTLEMVDIRTGKFDKESATIRKGYRVSLASRIFHK
jgi:hypothetical protein